MGELAEKNEQFETEGRFQQFKWEQQQALEERMRAVQPGQAEGFADNWVKGYKQSAKEFLASVPASVSQQYDQRLFGVERELYGPAAVFGRTEQKRFSVNTITDSRNGIYLPRATSGEPLDGVRTDYRGLVERNPYLTPVEKDEVYRKGLDDIEQAHIQGRIARGEDLDGIIRDLGGAPAPKLDTDANPELRARPFEGEAPGPAAESPALSFSPRVNSAIAAAAEKHGVDVGLLATFARIESGGRSGAETGSYKGLFQLSHDEFEKHGGRGDIFDPEANADAAAAKLKGQLAEFEAKHGRPATPLDLYMIHQQGEAGYEAHVANPEGTAWQNIRPYYSDTDARKRGFANGDAYARAAIWGNIPDDMKARFPGGVESVSSAEFFQLWQEKMARLGTGGGAASAQAAETYRGPYTSLPQATRHTLLTQALKMKEAEREQIEGAARFHAMVSGAVSADPSSKEDRDIIDTSIAATDVAKRFGAGDANAAAQITALVANTGYVPKTALSQLRAMATNGDDQQKQFAYETTANIMRVKPGAFEDSDQSRRLAHDAQLYDAMTLETGLPGNVAVQRIAEMHTPEFEKRREALKPEADKLVKTITADDLVAGFGGWFTSAPELGGSPRQAGVILDAYRNLVRESYIETADPDIAKASAKREMLKVYGVSEVTGKKRLMRLPPENYYPRIAEAEGETPGFGYFTRQLKETVNKAAGRTPEAGADKSGKPLLAEIPIEDIFLEPIAQTNADVKAGKNVGYPGYAVVWLEDSGDGVKKLQTAPGMVFRAEVKPELARQATERKEAMRKIRDEEIERRKAIEEDPARRAYVFMRDEIGKQIKEQPSKPAMRLRLPDTARLPTADELAPQGGE